MRKIEYIRLIAVLITGIFLYVGWGFFTMSGNSNKTLPPYYIKPLQTNKEKELLPSFNILLPDSTTYVNIGSLPKGMSTVLLYFGPDCPFCQAEIKEIIANIDQLGDIRFYIITPYSFNEMKNFYLRFHLSRYSNICIGTDYSHFLVNHFKIKSIPFTAIFSKDNKLTAAFIGVLKHDQLKEVSEI